MGAVLDALDAARAAWVEPLLFILWVFVSITGAIMLLVVTLYFFLLALVGIYTWAQYGFRSPIRFFRHYSENVWNLHRHIAIALWEFMKFIVDLAVSGIQVIADLIPG